MRHPPKPKPIGLKEKEQTGSAPGDERNKVSPMVRAYELLAGLPDDMFPGGLKDDPPQRRKFISFPVSSKRAAKKGPRK